MPSLSFFLPAKKQDKIPSHVVREQYAVLIVDDNMVNRKIINKQVTAYAKENELQIGIKEAADGIEALCCVAKRLANHEPEFDLILMDTEMPELDGITTSAITRELESETNVPDMEKSVIASCSTIEVQNDSASFKINKPVDVKELREVFDTYFRKAEEDQHYSTALHA